MKAEKAGDRKVLFSFRGNVNRELPLIVSSLPILPSKWWAGKDFEKVSLEPALGSGAYKIDAVDVGRSISYRRVPDWWAKDLWMNRGRNNFEAIRYDYYRDNNIVFEAFKAGDLDIRRENSGRNWKTATTTCRRSRTAASCARRSRTRTPRPCSYNVTGLLGEGGWAWSTTRSTASTASASR